MYKAIPPSPHSTLITFRGQNKLPLPLLILTAPICSICLDILERYPVVLGHSFEKQWRKSILVNSKFIFKLNHYGYTCYSKMEPVLMLVLFGSTTLLCSALIHRTSLYLKDMSEWGQDSRLKPIRQRSRWQNAKNFCSTIHSAAESPSSIIVGKPSASPVCGSHYHSG